MVKKRFVRSLFCSILGIFFIVGSINQYVRAADFYVVSTNFVDNDGDNYWGPYGEAVKIAEGALVFDSAVENGWMTLNFKMDTLNQTYRYGVISIKSDKPTESDGLALSFGQSASGDQIGKALGDWILADGSVGIKLTEEYQLFAIDLEANQVAAFGTEGKPDFALNKGEAGDDSIAINKIYLANSLDEIPEEASGANQVEEATNNSNVMPLDHLVLAEGFKEENGGHYWGPYGNAFSLVNEELVFDATVQDAWTTMDFKEEGLGSDFKYLLLSVRANDVDLSKGISLSFGQDEAGNQLGKSLESWILEDGSNLTLHTEKKTYVIDLAANGFKGFDAEGKPDFALNKGDGNGIIYISEMILTNQLPTEEPLEVEDKAEEVIKDTTSEKEMATTPISNEESKDSGNGFKILIAVVGGFVVVAGVGGITYIFQKNKK